jgi:spore coat protein CotH
MNPRLEPLLKPCFRWATLLFVAVTPAVAAPSSDQTDAFYDPATVQTIHLEIKPEDVERMRGALPERISVPGTFKWNSQVVENVGIRYKGNSSSMPQSPFRRSFLVEFNEFKDGQRFLGLRNVALDNGIQFGSLFSERLVTDILRGVGVKVSRCNYARVHLNGTNVGVYVNVERVDKSFLARYFGSDKGPLFKVDEGGPGADLQYLGSDPAAYQRAFELHSGKAKQAYPALIELIKAVSSTATTADDLKRVMDIDAFLKTTAVMLFAGAFDQYTGWQPHNYYLYQNPLDRRWSYIPWDLDVGFADQAFGRVPVLEGWHAAWPAPVPGRPLMEHLVTDTNLLQQYREEAGQILEQWFRPDVLIPKLHALHAQIRADLALDPSPARRATVPRDQSYDQIITDMESFIKKRYALAREQLNAPGRRPAPTRLVPGREPEGPQPGPASPDSPAELHAIVVSSSKVELGWTDRSEGEMAFVVQRCSGPKCQNFSNALGQPSDRGTIAIDTQVQPGETYRYRVFAVLPTSKGPRGTGVSNVVEIRIPED